MPMSVVVWPALQIPDNPEVKCGIQWEMDNVLFNDYMPYLNMIVKVWITEHKKVGNISERNISDQGAFT